MKLIFRIELPMWLHLPDGDYAILFYNSILEVVQEFTLKLNNHLWDIRHLNKFGEVKEQLTVSENFVLDENSLKLRMDYEQIFNEYYKSSGIFKEDQFFPLKVKTNLEVEYEIAEDRSTGEENEQNQFIMSEINREILPAINYFLEKYRFYIAEDSLFEDDPFKRNLRSNNIQRISYYDLSPYNTKIKLIKNSSEVINFELKLFPSDFGAELSFLDPTRQALKLFKDELIKKDISIFEILWGEVKYNLFKGNWRITLILSDILMESLKDYLNREKIQELREEFEKNKEFIKGYELSIKLIEDKLEEKEKRGIRFFLKEQAPIFYKDLISEADIKILKQLHQYRNEIIHGPRKKYPKDFEIIMNRFSEIFLKIYDCKIRETNKKKLQPYAHGFIVGFEPSKEFAKIKMFTYKSQVRIYQFMALMYPLIDREVKLKISKLSKFENVLPAFSKKLDLNCIKYDTAINIYLKRCNLDIQLIEFYFRLIRESLVQEFTELKQINIELYNFIFPDQFQKRVTDVYNSIFLNSFKECRFTLTFQEINSQVPQEINWNSLYVDEYYVGLLNNIGVIFINSREWEIAEHFLFTAENLAFKYNLIGELARVKYNIACYYSFKGEMNNAGEYLRNSCRIDSKYEREWISDDHFENLRKSGFHF